MKTTTIEFKNRPNEDGTVTSSIKIPGCLISQSGGPATTRPQIIIHLPKKDKTNVQNSWVEYFGKNYHIIGLTAPNMESNTPTLWDRYAIAEQIY